MNLKLRKDALDNLRLPIDVIEGNLGELTLSIPWSNLKTKPVKVHIRNVYLLAAPKTETTVTLKDEEERAQQMKQQKLEAAELFEASKHDSKSKDGNDSSSNSGGFVHQLTTKVIDNLQLSFENIHIRYEDQVSCVDQPFAVGITLKELSAISTDGDWQPAFIGDLANTIHKLATLNSLSVYWNTGSTSLAGLPSDQAPQIYTDLIPTADNVLKEHQYIVKPVSGVGKIKLNKVYDEKVAQVDTTLLFEELAFGLDNEQYRDALLLVDLLHSNLKKQQHLKFRPPPGTSPKSDPRAYFKYAGQTVLARIHERNYRWTWDHFKKRRDERLAYIDTYLTVHLNKATSQQKAQLTQLERDLSFEDIRFYRSIAKRHLRKDMERDAKLKQEKAKKGWFGSLWSSSNSPSKDDDGDNGDSSTDKNSDSTVLTDEQRKELYAAIDYDEDKDDIANSMDMPKNTKKFVLNTKLNRGSIQLIQNPHSTKHQIASIVLDTVGIQAIQYADSMKISTTLGDLQLFDGSTKDTLYPQLIGVKKDSANGTLSLVDVARDGEKSLGVQSTQLANNQQPFLAIDYQLKPLDKKADQAIKVVMRHLEIIYNPTVIQEILSFFKGPSTDSESFDALVQVAGHTLEGFKQQTRAGLQHALENHTTLDLDVDMKAPVIIIPENCLKEDSAVMIVDTGHIRVNSDLANQDLVEEFKADKAKNFGPDDYKRLEGLMYDKIRVELTQIKLLVGRNLRKCLAQLNVVSSGVPDGGDEYVLYGVDMNLLVEQCILPGASQFAKFRIYGKVPVISMNLSPQKYKALMMIVNRITSSSKDDGVTDEPTDGIRQHRTITEQQKHHDLALLVDNDNKNKELTPQKTSTDGVQLDFKFDMDLLCLELFSDSDKYDNSGIPTSLCRLSLDNTSAKLLTTTKQAMEMELQIQSINLCDTRQDSMSQFTDILPAGKQLDGPQIQVKFKTGTKTTDGIPISDISVTLDRPEMILSLDYLMLLKEFFAPPDIHPPQPTEAEAYVASLLENKDGCQQKPAKLSSAIKTTSPSVSSGTTRDTRPSSILHFNIAVVGLEVVCLANPDLPHSEAMVLSFKRLSVCQQEQFALQLDGIGLFLCRMGHRAESLVSLVEPFGVDLDMQTQSLSARQKDIKINSYVQPITLRISYRDILLIMDIVNKVTTIVGKRTNDDGSSTHRDHDDDKYTVNDYMDDVLNATSLNSPSGYRLARHESRTSRLSDEQQARRPAKLQPPSNQSGEIVTREVVNARFEQFQLLLIEDLHDLPFMDFVIKPFNVSVSDWSNSIVVNTKISTRFNYFNFKNSLWEPVIEPYDFDVNVNKDPTTNALDIGVSSTETMNINLSHVFLETLLSISSTLSEIQPLPENTQKQIKPFVIENCTGHVIRFWNMSDDIHEGDANMCLLKDGQD
ncbi:unnamed protein product [Absidia cylindrospora]